MRFILAARKFTGLFPILGLFIILLYGNPCRAQEEEETYSISLVKTADMENADEIKEVDGKKVLVETYTVEDGDHLWQLLRERDLLEKRNLAELISVLKRLNSSLENIDMIHPGEKIIIPLVISPAGEALAQSKASPAETVSLESIEAVDLEKYVVKQGDSIIKIVEDLYDIPQKELYNEYLSSLKQLNPFIQDLNAIYPGQKIRLPIYSPKVVRQPIRESLVKAEPMTDEQKGLVKIVSGQLGELFTLIGEQWLQTGEHFFPLKTGGQLKLNAESYPVLDLKSGKKVIVDLYNDLPERMGNLITSNWDNYGIVHLDVNDDLRRAFEKIIGICGYKKVYGPGEPLVLGGEIPLRITADMIVEQGSSSEGKRIAVINLCDDGVARSPDVIVSWLALSGIKVVDYPVLSDKTAIAYNDADVMDATDDERSFIETFLGLTGQSYSSNKELPVYENGKGDFDLVVKADFSVSIGERDYIIDLSGLGKDITGLLKEHQYMVHSISGKETPSDIITGIFDFLGVKYEAGPHQFFSTSGPEGRNIVISIQGITFTDSDLRNSFATSLRLSHELILFLNMNGYRVLQLPVSVSAAN